MLCCQIIVQKVERTGCFGCLDQRVKRTVKNYQFWGQDNHPIELDSNEMMDRKLEYIHNNPVREGIVDNPADYLYGSARNYKGLEGLIKVTLIA